MGEFTRGYIWKEVGFIYLSMFAFVGSDDVHIILKYVSGESRRVEEWERMQACDVLARIRTHFHQV